MYFRKLKDYINKKEEIILNKGVFNSSIDIFAQPNKIQITDFKKKDKLEGLNPFA